MTISLTSSHASNWVDRGEPPTPKIARTLAYFFDRHDASDGAWLAETAEALVEMVAADASEVLLAEYLQHVAQAHGIVVPARVRATSVAAWHIAKAALVRDAAVGLLNSELATRHNAMRPPLATWLAERLLTAEELTRYAADQDAASEAEAS